MVQYNVSVNTPLHVQIICTLVLILTFDHSKDLLTRRNFSPGCLELELKIVENWPNKA